jgi:hypothetical protein
MLSMQLNYSQILRRGSCLLAFAGLAATSYGEPYVLNNEFLHPQEFPAADGWTIALANRDRVIVQDYGLYYDVVGGRRIEGGVRSVLLNGGVGTAAMNQFLILPVEPPEGPTTFFSVVFNAESIGTNADPAELFIRFAGWNAYAAAKLFSGIVELPGGNNAQFADEGTAELAGVNHLLVGKISSDANGGIRRLSVWLNPTAFDETAPLLTATYPGTVNISSITQVEVRSQKVPIVIDNLTFGESWDDVVPPLPADPGNITLTLPADSNAELPGIQMNGGTLFVEVNDEAYVAGTILPVGTMVTYRAVPNAEYEVTRWNNSVLTGDEIQVPVYAVTNISPVFETGDFRVVVKQQYGTIPIVQISTNAGASWSNTQRRLFDAGELIRINAGVRPYYALQSWEGELSPLNPAEGVPVSPSPGLTVGQGALWADGQLVVEVKARFNVRESVSVEVERSLNLDRIELDFDQAGIPESVPVAEFNRVLEAKYDAGLGGVVTFDDVVTFSGLIFDPRIELDTPAPDGFIEYNEDGTVASSALYNFLSIRAYIPGRENPVIVTGGPWNRTELGGAVNLATAAGPGPISPNEMLFLNGEAVRPWDISLNPGGREPTSGRGVLGGPTSYDYAFDVDDKVVMAGMVYLSRNDFQHHNPDGLDRMWGRAIYSDGTTSPVLSSNKLRQSMGEHDHFLGFSAPAGKYITNIQMWIRGGNNRAFSNGDDLVFVLEGPAEAEYSVSAVASPLEGGMVTEVSVGPYNEGDTVTLSAMAQPGYRFGGWAHAASPENLISMEYEVDYTLRSNLEIVALFDAVPYMEQLEAVLGGVIMDGEYDENTYYSNWMGFIYSIPADLPWVWTQDHGWLYAYAVEDPAQFGWFYDLEVGFIYTTEDYYPAVWVQSAEDFYFYIVGTREPRIFYNYATGEFVNVPRSGM